MVGSDEMTAAEVLMTAMMALISVLIAGGIPWAYVIGQKVTRIEAKLSNGISERLDRHSDNLETLDQRMNAIERAIVNNPDHVRRVTRERERRQQRDREE